MRYFNGDGLRCALVVDRIASDGKIAGAAKTQMTNLAVEVALQRLGVAFERAATECNEHLP
ncbi:MAG: hypothetical protein ON057_001082 [Glomeribacter sp. 1016415]|nr:hypothetical protein [Glomeribacter sp. 1016415]